MCLCVVILEPGTVDKQTEEKDGSNMWIVGVVVGAVILLLILFIVLFVLWRRKSGKYTTPRASGYVSTT